MPTTSIPLPILKAFYQDQAVTARPLGDGMVNITYLVTDEKGKRTVLQKLSEVFDSSMAADYAAVSKHLLREGWEVPTPLETGDGQTYVNEAEHWWRGFSFIDSDGHEPSNQETIFTEAGALLAKLHASLKTLNYTPQFGIPHFHDTKHYLNRLAKIVPELTGEANQLANDVLEAYKSLPAMDDVKPQLIHGDPRTSNMLFRNGKPFTFIDFDTVMVASPWIDVGDLLRSIVENAVEAKQDFKAEQLQPLIKGYGADFRQAITAAQQITLELAARFLIDIVEDYYFAWNSKQYPSRKAFNLARAQLQWGIHITLQGVVRV